MKQIKLNDKVTLDLDKLIAGKMLLQAGSGGGKSFAIRRILEQSFGEIPHLILDTEGEFSSLREKYDYILIGKGLDFVPDTKTAGALALFLWEQRVSAIIDLYEMAPWDRQLFVKNFVDALINAPKTLWKPVLLVIDEAHEYAPENDKSDSGRALHLLASKGRKRKIGAIFATQRISSLSKNIVASCKNKLIGYASETNDVKRAAFELGFTPAEARGLRDLDPGEFYAFGPALTKEVTKIKIGLVKTSHEQSSTEGMDKVAPASAKVKAALAKLADLPQAAAEEARTVAELKAENRDLKRTLGQNQQKIVEKAPKEVKIDPLWIKKVEEFAVKKFKDTLYRKLLKSHGNVSRALEALSKDIDTIGPSMTESNLEPAEKFYTKSPAQVAKPYIKFENTIPGNPVFSKESLKYAEKEMKKPFFVEKTDYGIDFSKNQPIRVGMGAGERAVLIAIAQQQPDGMTREHITVQTGYKRSTRDAYIQRLVQKGYATIVDNRIHPTVEGIEALGNDYEPLPTGRELFEYLLRKLPQGEAQILTILSVNGSSLSREQISDHSGFKTSTRNAYIQRLATRQLVVVEGQTIRISEHLI